MRKALFALLASLTLVGCSSMVPKKVEFFQDKVQEYPEQSPRLRELERQAVQRAHTRAVAVVDAAVRTNAGTNVVSPAKEVVRLTEAVAAVEGPPKSPAPEGVTSEVLAKRLETAVAKFSDVVEDFKKENNHNAGKKIEGTGLIEIGYVWWVGGVLGALALLFFLGRLFLSVAASANPVAAAGLAAINAAGSVASKGAKEVVEGVAEAVSTIEKEVQDAGLKQKLLDALEPAHASAAHTHTVIQSMAVK